MWLKILLNLRHFLTKLVSGRLAAKISAKKLDAELEIHSSAIVFPQVISFRRKIDCSFHGNTR